MQSQKNLSPSIENLRMEKQAYSSVGRKKIMASPESSAGAECHCDGKTTMHMFLHKIIDSACLVTASW